MIEKRSQKTGARRQKWGPARTSVFWLLSSGFLALLLSSSLHAAPTQDDVFKKIQQSVGEREEVDMRPVLWLAGGGGAVGLLLWLLSHKRQKVEAPKTLNHGGKLLREVMKEVPLSAAELRQLKLLADSVQQQTGEPATPLTLLLCPSLLAKGLQAKPARLDRAAVAQVVRKMQLGLPEKSKK